ncbi:MAG: HAD family phosphatase [Verrucomicrobiales bacterium]|nr:HAD family phosphatase [Verrucomicrobiales bacterium]
MKRITTVLFDMDGLLVDTEAPSVVAWKRAAEQFGESIDDEILLSLIGRHAGDCLAILGEHLGIDLKKAGFLERYDDIYLSNFMRNGIEVKQGGVSLLTELSEQQVPRAVVTSSKRELAPRKLRLAELEHFFDLIVTGCEVEKSKPEPDIFLLAAEKLDVDPSQCVVLEDSYNGVRAAHRAGMNPVMIPDLLQPTDEMKELTTAIYSSLEEAAPFILNLLRN